MGKLYTWGWADSGRLGNNTTTPSVLAPAEVNSDTDWDAISLGFGHALAIKGGQLYAWGDNAVNELGDGTTTDSLVPLLINSDTDWEMVSAGSGLSLAIKAGKLYSWGSNGSGRTAQNTLSGNTTTPTQVGTATDWDFVSASKSQPFAVAIKGGQLYAWGLASYGALGNGVTVGSFSTPQLIDSDTDWSSLSAGARHVLAIKAGKLYSWGAAANGRLGNGTTSPDVSTPTQVGSDTTWEKVAAGNTGSQEASLAIKEGTLYSCGYGSAKGLGVANNFTDTTTFTQVGSDTDWSDVSAGSDHAHGLRAGSLFGWGTNAYAQVGDGTGSTKNDPVQIGSATTWAIIAGGRRFSAAIENANVAPANTAVPTVSGTAKVGQTLTTTDGTWDGTPTPTYAYKWQVSDDGSTGWTDISGATSSSFTITSSEAGKYIRSEVTATNSEGSATASSSATAQVVENPAVSTPTISGTAKVGQVLTGSASATAGFPSPSISYQWERSSINTAAGTSWEARSVPSETWRAIAYGNGLFAAVSVSGRVMTSPDGVSWTQRTVTFPPLIAEAPGWSGITYGNGLFVAVAQNSTNRVMTSADGITWTAGPPAEANQWISVTYGNGLFVATSAAGVNQVMTSPDGITWTARSAAAASLWRSVTYANGLFVAVASTGTDRVMTSPDGITWTARAAAEANGWRSVTYGNETFVAVADSGTNRVMTSPDGITWTARSAAEANQWYGITYSDDTFVAVAQSGTNRVMTSPDGITWTARVAAEANAWQSVAYGDGIFVAVANSGTNRVMTSSDTYDYSSISGATSSTYALVNADEGNRVRLTVTGTNSEGSATASSLPTALIAPSSNVAPSNTAAPTVSGTATVGETLTTTDGTWDGTPTPTYTYKWQVSDDGSTGWTDISGATSSSFTITSSEAGKYIRSEVTATNSEGSAAEPSAATSQVLEDPVISTPTISGTAKVGEVLTASASATAGFPSPSLSYEWQSSPDGSSWTAISGETSSTLLLDSSLAGAYARVQVTATNSEGTDSEVSTATSQITQDPIIDTPFVSGETKVGQTLTATANATEGFPTPSISYQWLRADTSDGSYLSISGATSSTYVLQSADLGKFIKVEATATNSEGSNSQLSAALGAITEDTPPATENKGTAAIIGAIKAIRGF